MKGVDLYTVGKLLGHSSLEMTQRYAHLSPEHNARAVRILDSQMDTYMDTKSKISIDEKSTDFVTTLLSVS